MMKRGEKVWALERDGEGNRVWGLSYFTLSPRAVWLVKPHLKGTLLVCGSGLRIYWVPGSVRGIFPHTIIIITTQLQNRISSPLLLDKKLRLVYINFFFFSFFWLHSMWYPSAPTRVGSRAPCFGSRVLSTGPPGKSSSGFLIAEQGLASRST